jgi:hypothetical protein
VVSIVAVHLRPDLALGQRGSQYNIPNAKLVFGLVAIEFAQSNHLREHVVGTDMFLDEFVCYREETFPAFLTL